MNSVLVLVQQAVRFRRHVERMHFEQLDQATFESIALFFVVKLQLFDAALIHGLTDRISKTQRIQFHAVSKRVERNQSIHYAIKIAASNGVGFRRSPRAQNLPADRGRFAFYSRDQLLHLLLIEPANLRETALVLFRYSQVRHASILHLLKIRVINMLTPFNSSHQRRP